MNRVIHFEIQADDIERAKNFYEKVLGWKVEKWMDGEGGEGESGMEYWGLITGPDGTPGINGGMYKRPADKKIYTYDCTVSVENIDQAIAAVKKNGGEIRPDEKTGQEKMEIPKVGWFAIATDTEGNNFSIMQPTEWQPK